MNKRAVQLGFEKTGRDLGLDNVQITNLWRQSLNYPEFNQMIQKMSDEKLDIPIETLDTISSLEKISAMQKEFEMMGGV